MSIKLSLLADHKTNMSELRYDAGAWVNLV